MLDIDTLRTWEGRTETIKDHLDLSVLAKIGSFFGKSNDATRGAPIDETWHWCFFHPSVSAAELSTDGHTRTGGFLPPFDLPRRMWGGSRLSFHAPLKAGEAAVKTSRVMSVKLKTGKSGMLGLVTVEHLIQQGDTLCRREEQDIIYRESARGTKGPVTALECPEGAEYSTSFTADPVTLFRYSALTYNAHRIHYDREYATGEEGYRALVVHGPLTASLLAQFSRSTRSDAPMRAFSFRGTSPLFDSEPFTLHSRSGPVADKLWVAQQKGGMAMTAEAAF
ncbi:MaoC family dehydratase N-terminal domain-containing protein [Rhodobacteraceae bacterium D3-12]|nr:MaoC family dehydratase N-terminal domain-containing protein [Rhodobacteraceae bacterium D3-12]